MENYMDIILVCVAFALLKLVNFKRSEDKGFKSIAPYRVKKILNFIVLFVTVFGSTPVFADQVTMKVTRLVSYVTSIGLVAALGFFVYELLVAMASQMGFARVKWVAFGAVLMGIAKYLVPALIGAVS